MKTSSWAAIGWLMGTKVMGGKPDWTDAVAGGILAKNEVLDHDGLLHPSTPSAKERAQAEIAYERELAKMRAAEERARGIRMERKNQGGLLGSFWQGYYGEE